MSNPNESPDSMSMHDAMTETLIVMRQMDAYVDALELLHHTNACGLMEDGSPSRTAAEDQLLTLLREAADETLVAVLLQLLLAHVPLSTLKRAITAQLLERTRGLTD